MDLNDPRRRLQALQNQNPSIRISAGPVAQPKINISQNNVPKEIGPVSTQGITSAKPKPVDTRAWGTKVFDTVNPLDDGRSWATPGTQAMPNFLQRNASPTGLFNIGKEIVQGTARYPIEFGATVLSPVKRVQVGNKLEEAGLKKGTPEFEKAYTEASKNAGSFSWQPSGWQKRLFGDAKVQNFAETGKDIKGAIKDGTGKDVNSGVVTAGIIGLGALPVIGSPIKKLAKGGLKLFGKGAKDADKVVKSIVSSSDPIEIKSMLGNVDDDVAQFLATETNPETVKAVVNQFTMDPNLQLSPEITQRLTDEGVSGVKQADTPYGAEYNPNDQSILLQSQANATDAELYHELGHHIFTTKLTPEEQQLFANIKGPSYQAALGRPGYREIDLISEDFSDYMRMALTGNLDQVPEELRPVIQKYSGAKMIDDFDAAKSADNVSWSEAGINSKEVVKDPRFANVIAQSADPNDISSLGTVTRALALSKKKNEVRGMVEGLYPGIPNSYKNQLVKKLTDAETPEEVSKIMDDITTKARTPDAPEVAPTPAQQVDEVVQETGQANTGSVATTIEDGAPKVNTKVDDSLVKDGLIDGKVTNVSSSKLTLGSDTVGDIDPEQVAKYIDDISNGRPIEPIIVQRGPNGEYLVQDGKHRLEALKALGIEDVPTTGKVVTKAEGTKTQSVDDLFPDMDPESRKAVQEVMDNLHSAEVGYKTASKARSKETAQRIQAGNAAFEQAGGGEAGVRAKMAALKGKKTSSNFEPISVSDESQSTILNDIEKSDMMDYEKLNTQNAFRKLWGAKEEKPAPHDIKSIRNYFNKKEEGLGDVIADQVEKAAEGTDTLDTIAQAAGIPRTLMTIADASAPRQLAVALSRHPIVATKAYLKSFEHMFSGKKFDESTTGMEKLTDEAGHNYFEFMDSVMNMHLPNVAEKAAEEQMSSAPMLSKVPFVGRVVDASNRGMSSAVAHTRFNLAKKFIDDAGGVEAANKMFTKQELADLGEVLNTVTGRGGKKGGFTDRHSKILSQTLFSGKLWGSRMNMLNPYWYYRLSGPARKEALQSAASFAASAGAILTLINQIPGVEVGADPTSADFAKIKVGNTRYDILGGFQQNIRVAAQIATGKRTNSTNGESKDTTMSSVLGGLIEGKANPLLGYAYKLMNTLDDPDSNNPLKRVDEWGEPLNAGSEAVNLAFPLNITGMGDTISDTGSVAKGVAMSIPGFFGAGVQTYGDQKTKDTGKDGKFAGKVTEDMVTGPDGNAILDDKGKVIKVKFPKDATDLEKEALKADKYKSALTQQYKQGLSGEDKALLNLSEDQLQAFVDSGKIDKDRLKSIQEVKQRIDNLDGIDIPAEAQSDTARTFYQTYNAKSDTRKKEWLNEKPDENSIKSTEILNSQRPEGLSEYKPSNKLAKMYADLEVDLAKHPEYSEFDLRKKNREFHKAAAKLNLSDQQNEIYASQIGDLKYMIDEKQVAKEDLDAAIKLDDELYNSGLSSTLHFSKSFRNTYGFGLPSGGKGNPSMGGGSGGSGDSTPRTGINSLLPSFKTGGGSSEVPKVSAKARTKGITFKDVNLPSKSSGKKVTIKL